MLSICHLEMICQCGIIWSRFICWEKKKKTNLPVFWCEQWLLAWMEPTLILIPFLCQPCDLVLFHFLTTEPKYSTWFYHWLIHWRVCWLHMLCHAEVWAIQSKRHNEKKEMEWPSPIWRYTYMMPFEHHQHCSVYDPAKIFLTSKFSYLLSFPQPHPLH